MQMYEFFPQMDQLRQVDIEAASPGKENNKSLSKCLTMKWDAILGKEKCGGYKQTHKYLPNVVKENKLHNI